MMLPVLTSNWQRAAGFAATSSKDLTKAPARGKLGSRARASYLCRAFVCQDRYPSPSKWPGSQSRVRSLFLRDIGQAVADFPPVWAKTLASRPHTSIYANRGCGTCQTGGRILCDGHLHSRQSLRFSHLPRAATPILSAAFQAQQSGRSQPICWAGTSSQGPQLAVPQVFCATILRRKRVSNLNQLMTYQRSSGHHAPATVVVLAGRQTTKEGTCLRKS